MVNGQLEVKVDFAMASHRWQQGQQHWRQTVVSDQRNAIETLRYRLARHFAQSVGGGGGGTGGDARMILILTPSTGDPEPELPDPSISVGDAEKINRQ